MKNQVFLAVFLLFFLFFSGCQQPMNENEYPDCLLAFSDIKANSLTINWDISIINSQPGLEFCLVYSDTNNISTVSDALANGTVAMDWTSDKSSVSIYELNENSTYYFNAIVRDSPDNIFEYQIASQATKGPRNDACKLYPNIMDLNYGQLGKCVDVSWDGLTVIASYISNFGDGLGYSGSVFRKKDGTSWEPASYTHTYQQFDVDYVISPDASVILSGQSDWFDGKNMLDRGAVLVYVPTLTNSEKYQQTNLLRAASGGMDDFGCSVAVSMDGSTIAIGAKYDDLSCGSVYIFELSSGSGPYRTWEEKQRIMPSVRSANNFGTEVAISADGSVLVIDENTWQEVQEKKVYIFTRQGSTWTEADTLIINNSDITYTPKYGSSISVSDDGSVIVIGAYADDMIPGNSKGGPGSVYVYERDDASSSWSLTDKLVALDAEGGDSFGYSVDVSGDGSAIVIGAPQLFNIHCSTSFGPGSAYLFVKQGSTWLQADKFLPLAPSNASLGDNFGCRVAISGNGSVIVIGAKNYQNTSSSGAVYVF